MSDVTLDVRVVLGWRFAVARALLRLPVRWPARWAIAIMGWGLSGVCTEVAGQREPVGLVLGWGDSHATDTHT